MINKKIKLQKTLAIVSIFFSTLLLITILRKPDFDKHPMSNYVICGSIFVFIICAVISLRNSLRKEKNQNN